MLRLKISIFIMLALSAALLDYSEARDIRIDVTKPAFRKIAAAVPDLRGDEELGAEAAEAISYDLEFSGYFEVIDNRRFIREAAERGLDFSEWRAVGAEYLVWGSVERQGGSAVLEGRLFDAGAGREILGRRYSGAESRLRDMAHRFSDEIVKALTGQEGIAQTKILFVSSASGSKEIWKMDYDGHNPTRITRDNSLAIVPSWIPGGRRISFTSYRENNPDFYVLDLDTGRREMLLSFSGLNYNASWSPDGRRAAVTLTKDGQADIYIIDDSGRVRARLTNSRAVDCSPAWSTCGRYIAFNSGRMGGPHIFVMDSSGRNVRRLTTSGNNGSPQWSPDSSKILFTSRRAGKFDVFTVNADGTGETQISRGPGNKENASFSPDGRHIVYSSTGDGSRNIYVMRSDGSDSRRLTYLGGASEFPAWSR